MIKYRPVLRHNSTYMSRRSLRGNAKIIMRRNIDHSETKHSKNIYAYNMLYYIMVMALTCYMQRKTPNETHKKSLTIEKAPRELSIGRKACYHY